jgi:phage terminase small subunit
VPEEKKETAFDRLNDRQKLFVLEYVKDFNATQAAIRAGYSVDTARQIGCENLTKPNIKEAVDDLKQEIWNNRHKQIGRIWNEHESIALQKADDYIEWDGETVRIKPFDGIDTRPVSGIKIKQIETKSKNTDDKIVDTEIIEIKFYDKQKSLDSLAKMAGIIVDKHEVESQTLMDLIKNVKTST